MCTAISFNVKYHYFGRNLDLEHSNNETVIITPRNFRIIMREEKELVQHYAMIGIGIISNQFPLYYDATNEYGLSMAGLNFPHYACYHPHISGKHNIASFELIPWILGQCKTIAEALRLLSSSNIVNIPFSNKYPPTPLHWLLADSSESIVLESTKDGLHIFKNPVGVLTNSPEFPYHINNLSNYMNLSPQEAVNRLCPNITLNAYSHGMGAFGLPGDLSSASRFVRAVFTKINSRCELDEESAISQFFQILSAVSQTNGCVKVANQLEKTVYSNCCNTTKGIYYYKTYKNSQITAINMFHENLDQSDLISYKLHWKANIQYDN